MKQSQTVNVEYAELMARAEEIERPLPAIPSANPPAPCALWSVTDAIAQLSYSADQIRLYLDGCEREWKSLADDLRKMAKAYEEVDEGAADSITNEGSAPDGTPASLGAANQISAFGDPDGGSLQGLSDGERKPGVPAPPPPLPDGYYEVKEAILAMEAGDHGVGCKAFVQEWHTFLRALQKETYRFRQFTEWEGEARSSFEQNFEQQRQWINGMVDTCIGLRNQAQQIADAHDALRPTSGNAEADSTSFLIPEQHPGPNDMSSFESWYQDPTLRVAALDYYKRMQEQSEEALKIYADRVSIPPLNPSMVPAAPVIGRGLGAGLDLGNPFDEGLTSMPTGMPTMPTLPTMPTTPDSSMLDDAAAAALAGATGPEHSKGMKPASVGVGGIGAGLPSGPLKPPYFPEPSPGPSGANGAAGPGRAMPGAGGGAMGGMGGAPMAPGRGQGSGEKGKRLQQDDQALYTEKRAWTEGFITIRKPVVAPVKREVLKREIVKPTAYELLDAC